MGKKITQVLERDQTLVTYFDNAPEEVVSYITHRDKTLFYLYTKHAFRGLGFARVLLNAVKPDQYTCETGPKWRVAAEKWKMSLNPWALHDSL